MAKSDLGQSGVSRRLLDTEGMNRVSDATAYARPDIARAVDDAEMVEDGYLASLSDEQVAWLSSQDLPTGRPS